MVGGGKNCCVPGCDNYFRKKRDVSYVSLPKPGTDDEWRGRLIAAISRGDKAFNPDTAKICSAHFEANQLLFHGSGMKLAKGALPTKEMPVKSVPSTPTPTRKEPRARPPPDVPRRVKYLRFQEVVAAAKKLTEPWVLLRSCEERAIVARTDPDGDMDIKIIVQADFSATIHWRGSRVPCVFNVEVKGLPSLLEDLNRAHWCPGSMPRSKACPVLVQTQGVCSSCDTVNSHQQARCDKPVSMKTPLSSVPTPALIREIKSTRTALKCSQNELDHIRKLLKSGDVLGVEEDMAVGLSDVMEEADITDPFIKLFWEEQKKAASRDPRGMRWHPMMIRFAIYLHYQSPRAYEALRTTGVLHLPNKSTLRDYTNFHSPQEGFQPHVFEELKKLSSNLHSGQRYVVLLHDEMAVRGDLVFDHRGGEMVGFINPQAWNFNRDRERDVAGYVLVFMVVGINSNIKQSLGYFATQTATSDVLFPLLWSAVAYIEQVGLKVICSTCDKASPNQRLIAMHGPGGVVHQTVNFYAEEERPLFFMSDPPHLVKTLRNNLESSRPGGTRCLWNNGQHLWWSYIWRVYNDDLGMQLRRTKLTLDHVRLTASSRMSVRLAAQVLSRSVAMVMERYHGEEVQVMADFLLKCDRFFDCLNSRSLTEHIQKRKADLAPYRDLQDDRFEFLRSFESYVLEWKERVMARPGFTTSEKQRMFLSRQTCTGILTTVRGFIGATQYLLEHGVTYVLSNVFCQDPVEEHFGRHRGLGHRSRNPSVYEFGHQENKLRIQRRLAFQFQPRGNVRDGREEDRDAPAVDDEPLPKMRRH